MSLPPIVLKGNLSIEGSDVSDQVTAFTISGTADEIEVPSTFGSRKTFKKGADSYSLQIDFLQGSDTTSLSMLFWDALADADGELEFTGTPYESGAASASNPIFSGDFVVTAAAIGGQNETVGTDSVTFRLLDRPSKNTGA